MKVKTLMQQLLFTTSLVQVGKSRGTAFIFTAESEGKSYPVLITNKHVAMGSSGPGQFGLFESDGAGQPKYGQRIYFANPDFKSMWVGHPDIEVDLAATFLGPFLHSANSQGKDIFYRAVSLGLFPNDEIIEDLDAIEPVVFIGYPNALFDQTNLTPIARRGYTATPVALDYGGKPRFLIDASVFPGSSGSPVFIYQQNGYRKGESFLLGKDRLLFVGVVASVHVQQSTGQIVVNQGLPRVAFNQLMDLGIVFNWTAVLETVQELFGSKGLPYGPAPEETEIIEGQEAGEAPDAGASN